MSALVRIFRRIFKKNSTDSGLPTKKSNADYIIEYILDESPYESGINKKCLASELFNEFFTYIGLFEDQDYFGFKNDDDIWLDPSKELSKQHSSKVPHKFHFMVKFYPSDPQNLHDEFARYLMVQQISNDILTGKLQTDNLELITDLSALLLQSWYGNFNSREHGLKFIKTHQFLPHGKCDEKFYKSVHEKYSKMASKKMVPADAEAQFLNKVMRIPLFGVGWYDVKGKNDVDIRLGLNPSGILVYEGDTNAGLFLWNQIENIVLKWKKIKIVMEAINTETKRIETSEFVFRSSSYEKTRELFRSCVEYHIFYQLASVTKPKKRSGSFFKRNSLFSLSSRTEFELHQRRSLGSSSLRRQTSSSRTINNKNDSVTRKQSLHSFKRAPSRSISMKRP